MSITLLSLSAEKETVDNSIVKVSDEYGITEDHNLYQVTLQKGYQYLFEVESTSVFKDVTGVNRFNTVHVLLKDSDSNLLAESDGLQIDNALAGITTITLVAQETGDYILDIFGKAGFANTDEYGNADRIDSPFTVTTQNLGQVDRYADQKTLAESIALDQGKDGFAYQTVTDGSIYDGQRDTDWFQFNADSTKDYIVTVHYSDGVYKRLDMGNNLDTFFSGDRSVLAGKDLPNTEQYYYIPTESGSKEFSVYGGKGTYQLTVEEANLDPESDVIGGAYALTLGEAYHTDLFSIYDTDFFKVQGLTEGAAYKVTLTTSELNSVNKNNDFLLYGNDAVTDSRLYDSTHLLWGGGFGWNGEQRSSTGGVNEYYFVATDSSEYYLKMKTFYWDNVKGDYSIQVDSLADEAPDTVADSAVSYETLQVGVDYTTFLTPDEQDVYAMSLDQAGLYTITMDGFGDYYYSIYDAEGSRFTEAGWYNVTFDTAEDDLVGINWSRNGYSDSDGYHKAISIEMDDASVGDYYFVIEEKENNWPADNSELVDFRLSYAPMDGDLVGGADQASAQSIQLGEQITAMMQTDIVDQDWFKVNLEADELYKINLDSVHLYTPLVMELSNLSTGERLYNNSEVSAGLTAVFHAVYQAAGNNMQKALDFMDAFSLDAYRGLITQFETGYTSTTALQREDFLLYSRFLAEMKSQFGNNDISIVLTDGKGNSVTEETISISDLNTKFTGIDIQFSQVDNFNSSFTPYVNDLVQFSNQLKTEVIAEHSITATQIAENQKQLSTVEVIPVTQSEYNSLSENKNTLETTLADQGLFDLYTLSTYITMDAATINGILADITAVDFSTASLVDLIHANRMINELIAKYEEENGLTSSSKYSVNGTGASDQPGSVTALLGNGETVTLDTSLWMNESWGYYLLASELQEALAQQYSLGDTFKLQFDYADQSSNRTDLFYFVEQYGYVSLYQYDTSVISYSSEVIGARAATQIDTAIDNEVGAIVSAIDQNSSQLEIAQAIVKIDSIKQLLTEANQETYDASSGTPNSALYPDFLTLSSDQQTALNNMIASVDGAQLLSELQTVLDSSYDSKSLDTLIDEIQWLDAVNQILPMTALPVEEQNNITVAVEDRKGNLINLMSAQELADALSASSAVINDEANFVDTQVDLVDGHEYSNSSFVATQGDYWLANQVYRDAVDDFNTLVNILSRVDPDGLAEYKDTYVADLFNSGAISVSSEDFQALIDATHGGSWYSYGNSGETYAVREDGEYALSFKLKDIWALNSGEYHFEVTSLNSSDAGESFESSADFRAVDYKDFTLAAEKDGTLKDAEDQSIPHAEDGVIQGIFSGQRDIDLYHYDFEALTEYSIKLDYPSGEIKLYDPNHNRISVSYADDAILQKGGDWLNPYLSFTPEVAGTYYIETSRGGNSWSSQTDYTLTIQNTNKKDSIGASIATAGDYLLATESAQESSSSQFKIDFDKDKDWFKIDTTVGNYYTLEVDSEAMKFLDLRVFDSLGFEVVSTSSMKTIHGIHVNDLDLGADFAYVEQDWTSTKDVSLSLFSGVGLSKDENENRADGKTYYVQVANSSETGEYNLTVALDTTADDFGVTKERAGEFLLLDQQDSTPGDNTIQGSFERRNDSDWIHYDWEKAVYQMVIDAPSVDKLEKNFQFQFGDQTFSANRYFDLYENFTANRNDDSDTARNYIVKAHSDVSSLAYLELKNIFGAGNYQLTINKLADLDEAPIAIVLDQNNSFSKQDDAIVYQTDRSLYQLDAVAETAYQIELDAIDSEKAKLGQLNITILDEHGNVQELLSEWNPTDVMERAIFTPMDSGAYTIEVKSTDSANTGAFSFALQQLELGSDVGSTVSSSGDFALLDQDQDGVVRGTIDTSIDKDWYQIAVEAGEQYLISINTDAANGNGIVYLYDHQGALYKAEQMFDTGDRLIASDKAILFNPAQDGDYYISVADTVIGEYELQVETYSGLQDLAEDTTTSEQVAVDGSPVTSLIDHAEDVDWIKVALEQGTVYKVEATPAGDQMPAALQPIIHGIYTADGQLIEGSSTVLSSQVIQSEASGNYYIGIASSQDTLGFYSLSVSSDQSSDAVSMDQNSTASMVAGQRYEGDIDYYYDRDWIRVSLEEGKSYAVSMNGKSLKDPHITGVFDASGTRLTDSSNNNAGDYTLNSQVLLSTVAGGDYFIEAAGYGDLKGSYTLEVEESTASPSLANETEGNDANNTPGTAISGTLGRSKYGEINYGSDSDLFAYALEAGVSYEINLYGASSRLGTLSNTYIRSVRDDSGVEIAGLSNARGGVGNDSLLSFQPGSSGTYYVEVASQFDAMGSYRVKVKEQGDTLGHVAPIGDGSHTMMVYLGGDNNLERYMVEDLIEMQLGDLPQGWNVTFLIDRAEGYYVGHGDWTDTRQGVITFADDLLDEEVAYTEVLSTMESLGELNTGDGETLTNFVNWSARMAEADSYSLILSNHGGGVPGSVWDDASNHDNITIEELTQALEATNVHQNALQSGEKGFSMVGFDTCLQGVLDQQYALSPVTDVVVASEEISWSFYWDYEAWFDRISEKSEANGGVVTGEDMGVAYLDTMRALDTRGKDLTYSVVETEMLDEVVAAFAELNQSFSTISAQDRQRIESETGSVVQFGDGAQIDLGAFASVVDSLNINGAGSSVDLKAQAVKQAVADAVIDNVTNMGGNGGDATGIAVHYNGGYASGDYMENFELAGVMNMYNFYEVA